MKKLLLFLLLSCPVLAQIYPTTTVTGTFQDPNGQVFLNGTYIITFVPTPGRPGPYTVNGIPVRQGPFNGVLDANGAMNLTNTLVDNSQVVPAGSGWFFNICPNATFPCTQVTVKLSGATQDISAAVNAASAKIQVGPGPTFNLAYQQTQIIPAGPNAPTDGMAYLNTTNGIPYYHYHGQWYPFGSGTGGAVAPCNAPSQMTIQYNGVTVGTQSYLNFRDTPGSLTEAPSGPGGPLRQRIQERLGRGAQPLGLFPFGVIYLDSSGNCASSANFTTDANGNVSIGGSLTLSALTNATFLGTDVNGKVFAQPLYWNLLQNPIAPPSALNMQNYNQVWFWNFTAANSYGLYLEETSGGTAAGNTLVATSSTPGVIPLLVTSAVASEIQIGGAQGSSPSGGFLSSNNGNSVTFSAGGYFKSNTWINSGNNGGAASINLNPFAGAGTINFFGNTGLTSGNTYAPTQIASLSPTGFNLGFLTGTGSRCLHTDATGNITAFTSDCGGGGGPAGAISALTPAVANNTIANAAYTQTWNWSLTGATNGMVLGENSAGTGTGSLLQVNTNSPNVTALDVIQSNSTSDIHLGTTANTGMYMNVGTTIPNAPSISAGAQLVNGSYIARGTSATLIGMNASSPFIFYTATGLTVGSAVPSWTPVFTVANDGSAAITHLQVTGGVNKSAGMQHQRVTSCTNAALANAVCGTTVTWVTPFADSNYTTSCTAGYTSSAVAFVSYIQSRTATNILVVIMNSPGNSTGGTVELDCVAMHD